MPTIRSRGTDVHFLDAGEGEETVLLLHAFPLNASMWAGEVAALSARRRVVAPEYPGLGRSEPRAEPSTMEALAEDVLAIVDVLRVRTAAVIGLSMGGYLAFELHRRRPALFRALALCDTRAGADTREAAAIREAFAKSALEKGLPWVADQVLPKLLKKDPDPAVASAVRGLIAQGTPEGVAAAQRGMAKRPDSTATLPAIACPTLVLVGAEDAFTPPAESRRMAAAIPDATLVEIPGAGHLSNLEQPAAFEAALLPFLAALR
jgi:pimeloyl-ACP methyl ester carboxylesterase